MSGTTEKATSAEFDDWRWQLREAICSTAEFARRFPERMDEISSLNENAETVERLFPTLCTPYYASLINNTLALADDPVFKQVFPDAAELDHSDLTGFDPLGEENDSPLPHLIHRYPDRVLLMATNACAIHCRFCLRKRYWMGDSAHFSISNAELDVATAYLANHSEVREVLISGGDPLMLETARIAEILSRISRVRSIKIIRLGTRIPVTLPMRVDAELVDLLASTPGLWVATHFNHPAELTDASLKACSTLVSRGVPILNQTVLLKGLNDSPDILAELFVKLAENRIKPHYLFHLDPVSGTTHFATGTKKGLEIMKALRNRISSVATPTFAIDLPDGGGKVPLAPEYKQDGGYEGIRGKLVTYYADSCPLPKGV